MITKNNWLTTNIKERLENKQTYFDIKINSFKFEQLSYFDSLTDTCNEISSNYKNLCIAFGGGIDSEFLVRLFTQLKIPFETILVKTEGVYDLDFENALQICDELGLNKTILTLSYRDFLDIYAQDIIDKLNGIGINSFPIIACAKYAQNKNLTLIVGVACRRDNELIVTDELMYWNDYIFYTDALFPDLPVISPFFYSPSTIVATKNFLESSIGKTTWEKYRCDLYKMPYRKKNMFIHQPYISSVHKKMTKELEQDFYRKTFTIQQTLNMLDLK